MEQRKLLPAAHEGRLHAGRPRSTTPACRQHNIYVQAAQRLCAGSTTSMS